VFYIEQNRENFDLASEALFIGSLFAKPILYVDYAQLIKAKYDFYDEDIRFLYNCFDIYYKTFSQEITETKIQMFMSQDEERLKAYKGLGGWKTIEKQIDLSDPGDIHNYFDIIKKFSLAREFERKGFPVQKILQHKKFPQMKAEDIVKYMRFNVDNINTVIGGGKSSQLLGKDFKSKIEQWRDSPDIGEEIPFPIWHSLFRGWRKGKLIVNGMMSGNGKSRRASKVANYIGVKRNISTLVLVNEQEMDEWYAMQASVIANNPEFGFIKDDNYIEESDILLGQCTDEQYQLLDEIGEWIQQNTKIYFLDLDKYSDDDLEREIKKHVLGLGVKYVFYDTLKGYKTDNWESVKQTTTKLKDICNELKIGGYATIQLTDDTIMSDELTSMNIANAKQLKHVVDHLVLEKMIDPSKYDNYLIRNESWGDIALDRNKTYYLQKIDKNRGGATGMNLITEVDLGKNLWIEKGYLIKKK
jgi:replicative DNA helicase